MGTGLGSVLLVVELLGQGCAGQVSDAAVTNLSLVQVIGWDNGGVEIDCLDCGEEIAAGGCSCCEDNSVTLLDLVSAARDHVCKEAANV